VQIKGEVKELAKYQALKEKFEWELLQTTRAKRQEVLVYSEAGLAAVIPHGGISEVRFSFWSDD
jgi:hypothetical protein